MREQHELPLQPSRRAHHFVHLLTTQHLRCVHDLHLTCDTTRGRACEH